MKNKNGCQEAQVKGAHGGSQCKGEPRIGEAESVRAFRGERNMGAISRKGNGSSTFLL